jgi:hypothetical protein
LALGIVFSAVLFKRELIELVRQWSNETFESSTLLGRPWPVFFGTGIGLGMGYSNCQNDLRSPYVPVQAVAKAIAETQTVLVSIDSMLVAFSLIIPYRFRNRRASKVDLLWCSLVLKLTPDCFPIGLLEIFIFAF